MKIYFSNWFFAINRFDVGDIKNTDKVLMDYSSTSVDNTNGSTALEQTVGGTREVQTQVQSYDLTTRKWEIGAEESVEAEFTTPLNFLGGAKIKMGLKLSQKGGQDTQTGLVTTTSDKTTVTSTVTTTVPPGGRQTFRINIFGTESRSDRCLLQVIVSFNLTFEGFLRWGGGNTPESNYHRQHRGSEKRPTVPFTFGADGMSFIEDLQYQLANPDGSVWDWNLLRQEHAQDLQWCIDELTRRERYTFNVTLGLKGVRGTYLEVKRQD